MHINVPPRGGEMEIFDPIGLTSYTMLFHMESGERWQSMSLASGVALRG